MLSPFNYLNAQRESHTRILIMALHSLLLGSVIHSISPHIQRLFRLINPNYYVTLPFHPILSSLELENSQTQLPHSDMAISSNERLKALAIEKGVKIDGKIVKLEVPEGKMVVVIPDMFASFLSPVPKVNSYYDEVKIEGENWICEQAQLSRFEAYLTDYCQGN
jgi:hypothetical protein